MGDYFKRNLGRPSQNYIQGLGRLPTSGEPEPQRQGYCQASATAGNGGRRGVYVSED